MSQASHEPEQGKLTSHKLLKRAKLLTDYTNTIAAIYLLDQVIDNGDVIKIDSAEDIINKENKKENPTLGNVIREILRRANDGPGEQWKWKKNATDEKEHLEVAITIGGAVYTVDFIRNSAAAQPDKYTAHITAKLEKDKIPGRGKLFFNDGHKATVELEIDENDTLHAVTQQGLRLNSKSFMPNAPKNEALAKWAQKLKEGEDKHLAVMGTGSGKSIIMAAAAQAVGLTVMIVPDKSLVDQQVAETLTFLGAGEINGQKKNPSIFTFDRLKDALDIKDVHNLSIDDKKSIKDYFQSVISSRPVLAGTKQITYDQIVLEAEHPFFKLISSDIKDSMVLLDESHQHTFTKEGIATLKEIIKNNSVLAVTATPTSKLYSLFPGEVLDDLSLGAVIELGAVRPIKPEVTYLPADDLVKEAVTGYFVPYYLNSGNNGYADPQQIFEQLKQEAPHTSEIILKKMAINKALELNQIRNPRSMSFSDDQDTRKKLQIIYRAIAEGNEKTIKKYAEAIRNLRLEALIDATYKMDTELTPLQENEEPEARKASIATTLTLPAVDLAKEIEEEQEKSIQRTINSHAISLIFGEKVDNIAEKDRSHKLESLLNLYDRHIKALQDNSLSDKKMKEKFEDCNTINEDLLRKRLSDNKSSPIHNLPEKQKNSITQLICERAMELVEKIKERKPISQLILQPKSLDLKELEIRRYYVQTIDINIKKNNPEQIKEILALKGAGFTGHIISDPTGATGISIKDILNVQIINTYSGGKIEDNPNAINGPLSCAQAAGRCVRHHDGKARVQQFIDERYKDKKLIVTVHDIIDPKNSAQRIKEVTVNRDNIQWAEKMVQTLERLTNNCLKGLSGNTDTYRIMNELKTKLESNETTNQEKVELFYETLNEKEGGKTKFNIINEDRSTATKHFIAGIAIVLLTVAGILPGLITAGIAYAVTGKKPWELLNSNKSKREIMNQMEGKLNKIAGKISDASFFNKKEVNIDEVNVDKDTSKKPEL